MTVEGKWSTAPPDRPGYWYWRCREHPYGFSSCAGICLIERQRSKLLAVTQGDPRVPEREQRSVTGKGLTLEYWTEPVPMPALEPEVQP